MKVAGFVCVIHFFAIEVSLKLPFVQEIMIRSWSSSGTAAPLNA